MDKDELEEIKKLPPEERIAKLKELEEKRKKEISEAEQLIQQSIEEARDDKQREQIEEILDKGEARMLQSETEKRIFESLTGEKRDYKSKEESDNKSESKGLNEPLEEAVANEQIDPAILQGQPKPYGAALQQQNMYQAIQNTASNDIYNFRQGVDQQDLDNYYKSASSLNEQKPKNIASSYVKTISDEILDNTIWARRVAKSMGYDSNNDLW